MAGEVFIDALPYYDQGYDEAGVKEAAYALIEEETRRYRPTKNYLELLTPIEELPFETEILKREFERMGMRLPMESLSMKRYELPPPPIGRQNDLSAWTECVENSMAQLEHQSERVANLDLLSKFGGLSWRLHNDLLSKMMDKAQKQLQVIRKEIQEINWNRKKEQNEAGTTLKTLQESWVKLVTKNYEIERACQDVELELDTIKRKQEAIRLQDTRKKRKATEEARITDRDQARKIEREREDRRKPERDRDEARKVEREREKGRDRVEGRRSGRERDEDGRRAADKVRYERKERKSRESRDEEQRSPEGRDEERESGRNPKRGESKERQEPVEVLDSPDRSSGDDEQEAEVQDARRPDEESHRPGPKDNNDEQAERIDDSKEEENNDNDDMDVDGDASTDEELSPRRKRERSVEDREDEGGDESPPKKKDKEVQELKRLEFRAEDYPEELL